MDLFLTLPWLASFYEHDPSSSNFQCIYFTKKGSRCAATASDTQRAVALRADIINPASEEVDIDLLTGYIRCLCCKFKNAKHRDRIEDAELLTPLAERWKSEIEIELRPHEYLPRYALRSKEPNTSSGTTAGSTVSSHYTPLSVFRPHVRDPGPEDTVSCKILEDLVKRDFETGSLYMFGRSSSPGYVKIGWTARSVEVRLSHWAKCGYVPNLLFHEDNVPFAQRAETLTHYELIKEWRTERRCKGPYCGGKSHQEWFEVSKEEAEQVISRWARVLKEVPLYDCEGALKPQWKQYLKQVAIDGKVVTAQSLWEHHESAAVGSSTRLTAPHSSAHTLKLEVKEEQENNRLCPVEERKVLPTKSKEEKVEQHNDRLHPAVEKTGSLANGKASMSCSILTPMEPTVVDESPVHKTDPSPKQNPLLISPLQTPAPPIASSPHALLEVLGGVHPFPTNSQIAELKSPASALPAAQVKQEDDSPHSLLAGVEAAADNETPGIDAHTGQSQSSDEQILVGTQPWNSMSDTTVMRIPEPRNGIAASLREEVS
ncbi:hypothetical protein PG996_005247 [Apiospora saccharicola]|uniref:Bacteriophage T5 Orf172 DNA-binding domain-containing protein n=1 Tax=Apiospora saccharicola TaxID=335842 RepID=A0ABR1VPR1_9PEZI